MSLYNIEYKPLYGMSDRFNSIILALESNSDALSRMSCDVMEGMEQEARMLAGWANVAGNRKEDFRKASECLQRTADVLQNSEKTVHGLISDVDCTSIDSSYSEGRANAGDQSRLEEYLRFFGWNNRYSEGTDWSSFIPVDWRYVMPLLFTVPGIGNVGSISIWNFIMSLFGNRDNRTGISDGTHGSGSEKPCVSPDVKTGCGVTDQHEEDFTDAESEVDAHQGTACCDFDDSFDDAADDLADEQVDGVSGVGASGAGASGGGAAGGASGSGSRGAGTGAVSGKDDYNKKYGTGDDGNISDKEYTKRKYDAEVNRIAAEQGKTGMTASGSSVGTGTSGSGTALSDTDGSGIGLAAPIIGVASAGSIAASGAALSRSVKADKDDADSKKDEKPALPEIAATEGAGVFSGNLKSEYVLLASTVALLFTGASLASAHVKGKKDKQNNRFRTGYGVSAVLDSGEIQIR